jgi:hypothetical protein
LADEISVAGGEFLVGVGVGGLGFSGGNRRSGLHVFGEADVFLVDLADGVEDVVEGGALVFLAPEEGDEAEGGEEAAGAGEDDVGAGGGFERAGLAERAREKAGSLGMNMRTKSGERSLKAGRSW